MTLRFETITAPEYWASALINNDRTSLSEDESAMLDRWLAREGIRASDFVSCDDEPRFTWSYRLYCPEAECAGGSVLDYTYQVRG